ncbi:Rv0340 family IniB-related protein [Mycobacterium asiaticum]|uniref:Isoniazid-inducible protein iniB n=1 Tax=Mycobacterium asiaticum TaxID=1790 RepID=A0A1A3N2Y4_MYCAS|nr:IniB N-terminal domain-containing protein [Mycobacterium asiaticum]OBK16498.1 hypothetical protein A5636_03230 [Mycobacterium asiaticum]
MANSLLDFVISLVRDPDAAARYAANPAQAIADAHLTDVTSTDVNNLIPVVSDSLSMAAPSIGGAGAPVADHGNVWASGAATAAFDAFTPHAPAAVVPQQVTGGVISHSPAPAQSEAPAAPQFVDFAHPEPSVLLADSGLPEAAVDHGGFPDHGHDIWDHSVIHPDAHLHDAPPAHDGFGIHG